MVFWKNWRNRSGRRIVDEFEYLAARHPAMTNVLFGDSLINADMEGLLRFSEILRDRVLAGVQRPLAYRGLAVVRPEMTLEACRTLKAAGCSELTMGIESGSQRILNLMKKGYRTELADTVLRNCREAGIRTEALLMVGFPTETAADFDETLAFVRRNAPNISLIGVNGNTYIDDGTALLAGAFTKYEVDEETFHSAFWRSRDGSNTYPERLRRLELLIRCAKDEGVPVKAPDHEGLLGAYDRWMSSMNVHG